MARHLLRTLAAALLAVSSLDVIAQQSTAAQQNVPAPQTNPALQPNPASLPQAPPPQLPGPWPQQPGYAPPANYPQGASEYQQPATAPPGPGSSPQGATPPPAGSQRYPGSQPAPGYAPAPYQPPPQPAAGTQLPPNPPRPNYMPQMNYAQQPGFQQPQAVYPQAPAYSQQPGYSQQASYPQQLNYSPQPGYPPPQGSPPLVAPLPAQGYASQPQPGAGAQPVYTQPQQPALYVASQQHASDQIAPYHVHRDTRHGHDHVYPDRGSVVRDVPRASVVVNYAGFTYRFYDGAWYEPRGPAYIVVAPPIGLVVPYLPPFATALPSGGETFFYMNDVYYRPRPDIGGYEVVNAVPETAPAEAAGTVPAYAPSNSSLAAAPAVAAPAAPLAVPLAAAVTPATATLPASAAALPVSAAPLPTAAPPATSVAANLSLASAGGTAPSEYVYPRNGQTLDQQARDRYECYRFAVTQTGFDPIRQNGGVPAAETTQRQSAYERAQAACFEGRGYTIR